MNPNDQRPPRPGPRQVPAGSPSIKASSTAVTQARPKPPAPVASKVPTASTAPPSDKDPLLGIAIEQRYRIERLLGSGGMARVYLGTHLKTGTPLAIKIIDAQVARDPVMHERCIKEARAMMDIRSNHVVQAFDVGSLSTGHLYVIMEYLSGEDLDALLAREGPLPWARVSDIAVQICSGLASAHRKGIIHRDIKPQNCFRTPLDDNPDHIKIIDFGIARDAGAETGPTQQGYLMGTPDYTAPELAVGSKADVRSDIYALGITLYKLLTGAVPFKGRNPQDTLEKHVLAPLVPPSRAAPHLEIPAEADELITRALAKDPNARFASVEEMGKAIRSDINIRRSGLLQMPVPQQAAPESRPATIPPVESKVAGVEKRQNVAPVEGQVAGVKKWQNVPTVEEQVASVEKRQNVEHAVSDAALTRPKENASGRSETLTSIRRAIDRRSLVRRGAILASLAMFFTLGTRVVRPDEETVPSSPKPTVMKEKVSDMPGPDTADVVQPDRELAAVQPSVPASDVASTPVPIHAPPPQPPADIEPTPKPTPPDEPQPPPVDSSEKVAPPEPDTRTAPEGTQDIVAEGSAPKAPVRDDEPKFNYRSARKMLEEQHAYLRNCMANAARPTKRLKFRIDVRPSGYPILKLFSGDSALRKCARNGLAFQFDPSPRGGAFEYILTETGSSLTEVFVDPPAM